MSEYSKFLNYFNTRKGSEKDEPDGRPSGQAEAPAPPELTYIGDEKEKTAEPADGEPQGDVSFRKNEPRFIRQEAEVLSAKAPEEPATETAVEKFTDRLTPSEDDAREHTGYTGKIDAVSANNVHESDTRPIGSVFEAAKAAREGAPGDAPEEGSTRHIDLPEGETPSVEDAAPTRPIGSGKGSLLREIAKKNAEEAGEDPDQLILEGFFNRDGEKSEAEQRAEKEMRRELNKTRQKRINDFHFWSKAGTEAGKSPDGAFASGPEKNGLPERLKKFTAKFEGIESGFLDFNCDEYKDPNDHRAVFKKLMDIRRSTLIRAGLVGLLGLILFIINIAAAVSAAGHNGFFTIMGGSQTAYVTTNLIFLALASFAVFDDIKEGIISLLQGHPKTDASLVLLLTVSFAQLAGCYLTKQNIEADFHLLTGAAILLCVPLLLAKTFYYDNTRHCFKSIAAKSEKSYLRRLSDKNLVASVLGAADRGDAEVVYAGKTRFIRGFIRRSRSSAAGGQISSRITLISMAASFLIGLVAMIVKSNVMWGFSAMVFSAALSFPVGCLFFTGFMIASENKALSVKSSFVRSYSDARDLAKVENIVLRAEDIFNVEITETVCIDSINRQQAELCAAVITEKTGGLLKKAFTIPEKLRENGVPEAEQLTYEDKLGFSAWVSDCRVLLGSNAFLSNHNVKMPDESGVLNFIDSENKPVYLAIEGHFTAMFSARYSCVSPHVKNLKTLADNGANILLVSSDPNITDAFAEKLLGLPADSVRVVSQSAAEKLAAQQSTVTDSEDTGIVFSGGDALCRCAFSAVKLDKLKKLSKLICEICCCAGCGLALVFALAGSVSVVSGWLIVLMQLLGMALSFFLPPLLTASSMPAFSKSAVRPVTRNEPFTPDNYVPRPQKIEDEEDDEPQEAAPPAETDDDMKIAPERGERKRFGRLKMPDWDEDDAYDDDDDDFGPPRRAGRFSGKLGARFAKPAPEPSAEPEDAPRPAREPMMARVPENPDDIPLSTEELLQSSFFRDEEQEAEEPPRRAPSPVNRYEEEETDDAPAPRAYGGEADGYDGYDAYDEYDDEDDDPFADGLLGKLFSKGKRGRRRGADSRYADDDGDAYGDEPRYDDTDAAPEEEAPRRVSRRPAVSAEGLSDAVKGLSSKMTSFAGKLGRKNDDYPADEAFDDVEEAPAAEHRPVLRPVPAGKRREQPTPPAARPTILSFAQDDPAPPHYELGKTDEYDFLNVKFEPPAVRSRDYYNDAYFSRFDGEDVENDADAVFSGLKEKPEE